MKISAAFRIVLTQCVSNLPSDCDEKLSLYEALAIIAHDLTRGRGSETTKQLTAHAASLRLVCSALREADRLQMDLFKSVEGAR